MNRFRNDYPSKTCAGILLGLGLAASVSALVAWATPDAAGSVTKRVFLNFLFPVLWMPVLGLVYLFPSGRQAWLWLALANLLGFGAYLACRLLATA